MASSPYPFIVAALLAASACNDGGAASTETTETPAPGCDAACGERAHCDPVDGGCYCDPGSFGDPLAGCVEHGDMCSEAAERVGQRVCVHELADPEVWETLSVGTSLRTGWRKVGKYLAPADPSAPLPVVFNDAVHYRLHYCMLKQAFGPLFPGFTHPKYNDFVYYRDSRQMFAGNIVELSGDDVPIRFGFTVETPEDQDELLRADEAYRIYRQLQDRFPLGDIGYLPNNDAQEAAVRTWKDAAVPIVAAGEELVNYEAY
ncbi:MAG: hypothetical protein JNK56_03445, partial [Myxococcales bacterium]|nr:hypothetical protein [Myxococcales bacterium]